MPTGVMGLVVAAAGSVRCMPALPDIGTANRLRESPPADWQGGRHLDPEARPEAAVELKEDTRADARVAAWFARNVRPHGM
jgi:hypothetical protein